MSRFPCGGENIRDFLSSTKILSASSFTRANLFPYVKSYWNASMNDNGTKGMSGVGDFFLIAPIVHKTRIVPITETIQLWISICPLSLCTQQIYFYKNPNHKTRSTSENCL